MIELFTARTGAPSVKVDGVAMHSPYDPAREAARFIQESLGDESPSTVIVLGECVGHVVQAVARLKPRAAVLAAVYAPEIARAAPVQGVPVWQPGAPLGFAEFLRSHLGELQIEGLRVLEWQPAARAFPAVSRAANLAVRQVVQELNGSLVTTVASGRRWLWNSFANFVNIETVLAGRLCPPGRPILVAAPGPSLEEAGPLIAEVREQVELWALPSSCPFLVEAGLAPDLVVMTDPGFYSMHHLQFAPPRCPLAMPLSAARGTWDLPSGVPVFFLGQPVVFEKTLLQAVRVTAPMLAPHGTVAATAIELALASTTGPVIAAGLDMSARDLRAHARPSAFDWLLHMQASRLQPHASLLFHRAAMFGSAPDGRAAGVRVSPALRTYAGWFDAGVPGARGRLHRLLPTAVPLSGMNPLDAPGLKRLLQGVPGRESAVRGTHLQPVPAYPRREERTKIARRVLAGWSSEITAACAAVNDARDLEALPRVLDFAHLLAPRRLVDALKKSREGSAAAARDSARETLTECLGILELLGERSRA